MWGEIVMVTVPLTVHGAQLLKDELQRLKQVERPAVITAISDARAQGDLSENAEYESAKERQSFIEGRVLELEDEALGLDRVVLRSSRRSVTCVPSRLTSPSRPPRYSRASASGSRSHSSSTASACARNSSTSSLPSLGRSSAGPDQSACVGEAPHATSRSTGITTTRRSTRLGTFRWCLTSSQQL